MALLQPPNKEDLAKVTDPYAGMTVGGTMIPKQYNTTGGPDPVPSQPYNLLEIRSDQVPNEYKPPNQYSLTGNTSYDATKDYNTGPLVMDYTRDPSVRDTTKDQYVLRDAPKEEIDYRDRVFDPRDILASDAKQYEQKDRTRAKTAGDASGDGSSYIDKYGKTKQKPISWVWNSKTNQYTDKQTGIVYDANGRKLNLGGDPTGTDTGPNIADSDGGGTGGGGGSDGGGSGGGDGGGGTGGNIWDPIGTGEDPMQFDTIPGDVGEVPVPEYYQGEGGPAIGTGEQVDGMTVMNPDGSVSPGTVDPTTREVQDEELVANQMSSLLNSDSKFMQDARRQGLEQSNAMGGLGGTAAVGAAMQSAMRSALPIATADAQAFRDAAAQNMDALNSFAQLNHQRATQMELANIDAKTRQEITSITTSAQMAAAALESATQRDISMLDAETKLRSQEMAGQIQNRLADQAFRHNALLADQKAALDAGLLGMKGDYDLAGIGLGGDYELENTAMKAEIENRRLTLEREATHARIASDAYSTYMGHITSLNGVEMDDNARTRAYASAESAFKSHLGLINSLYPDLDPIEF